MRECFSATDQRDTIDRSKQNIRAWTVITSNVISVIKVRSASARLFAGTRRPR